MRRLVTILLVVLIVGVSTVVIALLLKLKEISFAPPPAAAIEHDIPGLKPGERLISASADVDRITLVLEDESGARRAVVLDGRTFQPLGAVADR